MKIAITVFSIVVTIAAYWISRILARKYPSPLTTPVFLSTVLIIIVLTVCRMDYKDYGPAKDIMTYLLGPATVALAVPLYHNKDLLLKKWMPALAGLVLGTFSTVISAVLLAKLFDFSGTIAASVATKSVTTPVAIEEAKIIGGDPALSAIFVMVAGIFGAMFGPWLLNVTRISDPFSRGLSIGTVSHGIGTAQILSEGSLPGGVSGAAMGFASILTSAVLPWLFPLLF
ncbi:MULTISPECIES: LrgB family protein [Bacillus]|jgi:predicted murein hydrolase (TIGR00659 family)|uniref:LrgB family protein n=1 Tax=Bacillus TaxID=1386 RepID=UPI0022DEE5B3|nr:LrgB family protein [Bacillus smithii]